MSQFVEQTKKDKISQERLKQCLEKISSLYQEISEKDRQLEVVEELKYNKDLLLR